MKLCCNSRSYARSLQTGALTQLEWVDRCAALALDGVEFAASHFPRTDGDYLAQLKKLCADRGLTIASLLMDGVQFGSGEIDPQISALESWIDRALSLGSPLLRFRCGAAEGSPGIAWRELIRGLKHACVAAKAQNITLAMEPFDGSMVSTPIDGKRAIKECDSAWLRLAFGQHVLGAGTEAWDEMMDYAVLAVASDPGFDAAAARLRAAGYIGFVSLDTAGGDPEESEEMLKALRRLTAS
jgi:sugar phosphate isomerase/epimerase